MTPSPLSRQITPLSRPASTAIRSSLIIPTYPSVLQELIHNSLDADATKIHIYVDFTHGEEKIRVEDDGTGIPVSDLGRIGARYESSKKTSSRGLSSDGGYGYRGEGGFEWSCLAG